MKLTKEQAWKLHREQAVKVAPAIADELAEISFAVNMKENRPFDTNAKNPGSTARGMMQMLIGTQKELETKYLKVPHVANNIYNQDWAVYLAQYELYRQYKRYGRDWRKAIHAYNRGSYLPNNKKSFAAGEMYVNSVASYRGSNNYAALDKAINYNGGVVAANNSRSVASVTFVEWK